MRQQRGLVSVAGVLLATSKLVELVVIRLKASKWGDEAAMWPRNGGGD